ncbi:MAG TPA: hypothetical protein VIJ77_06385, partial [Candidatus Tumulicola sp.]
MSLKRWYVVAGALVAAGSTLHAIGSSDVRAGGAATTLPNGWTIQAPSGVVTTTTGTMPQGAAPSPDG